MQGKIKKEKSMTFSFLGYQNVHFLHRLLQQIKIYHLRSAYKSVSFLHGHSFLSTIIKNKD